MNLEKAKYKVAFSYSFILSLLKVTLEPISSILNTLLMNEYENFGSILYYISLLLILIDYLWFKFRLTFASCLNF